MPFVTRLIHGKTVPVKVNGVHVADVKCNRKRRVVAGKRSKTSWELVISKPNQVDQANASR